MCRSCIAVRCRTGTPVVEGGIFSSERRSGTRGISYSNHGTGTVRVLLPCITPAASPMMPQALRSAVKAVSIIKCMPMAQYQSVQRRVGRWQHETQDEQRPCRQPGAGLAAAATRRSSFSRLTILNLALGHGNPEVQGVIAEALRLLPPG
jgi:hypothetical protein